VGKEIKGAKTQQPSDERRTRLGHLLNGLVGKYLYLSPSILDSSH
jgi:hypothetical protein